MKGIRQKDSEVSQKDLLMEATLAEAVAQSDQPAEYRYSARKRYKTHQTTERHSDYSRMEVQEQRPD